MSCNHSPAAVQVEHVSKLFHLNAYQGNLRSALVRRFRRKAHDPAGELWALKDISFEIPRGQAFGILGPNGAGKSTMLKLLSRVSRPTSGTIRAHGRLAALIELGAGFHPELSGRENIYLNGTILGLSRREIGDRFDTIVEFSGLERFIDTPVKRYSSGMYVRLGFAVAAHVEPDILLVDEVLAVGDAEFRLRCAKRIAELQQLGTTIILVSHNLYLIRSLCEAALFLERGELKALGNVVEVISEYEATLRNRQIQASVTEPNKIHASAEFSSVQITGIEISNVQVSKQEFLRDTDIVEICVHFLCAQPVENPNLVLRIIRADGATACMIRTGDYGHALDELQGQGSISLVIEPLQLIGGAYNIEARLYGELDGVPLAQAYSPWFQVSGPTLSHLENCGIFVPKVSHVQINQVLVSRFC